MAYKLIKSRILLPIGTLQLLSSKYEGSGKTLSAGELMIVKTASNKFYLSAGIDNNVGAKLKVDAKDIVFTDTSSTMDMINWLSARNSELSSSLSDYYIKNETSSASELSSLSTSLMSYADSLVSSKADMSAVGGKVTIYDKIENIIDETDLSIVKLENNEYVNLVETSSVLSNTLYIIENSFIDAYGELIKNVAEPTDLSDAATKRYVDLLISVLLQLISELCSRLA